jgi:hypothetical protein
MEGKLHGNHEASSPRIPGGAGRRPQGAVSRSEGYGRKGEKSRRFRLPLLAALAFLLPVCPAVFAGEIPLPTGLRAPLPPDASPGDILRAFTGIPYRKDGVIDEEGRYTLFAARATRPPSPGLNCSGHVLAAARFLFRRNISLDEAGRDRLGDSGPCSPYGQDWDLGWDLILNISEGLPRRFLLPGNAVLEADRATPFSPRGFDLHDPGTWPEIRSRLRRDSVCLASFNKDTAGQGRGLRHYHVAILSLDEAGDLWLHQTTGAARRSYGLNLSRPGNLEAFLSRFANTGKARKHILLLETRLPGSEPALEEPFQVRRGEAQRRGPAVRTKKAIRGLQPPLQKSGGLCPGESLPGPDGRVAGH